MYAHAQTYPSLHTRSTRTLRVTRRVRRHRVRRTSRPLFLPGRTQHMRVIPRERVARVSWSREIARVTVVLANVAALSALLYLFF